jgi:hypothetical protein
MGLFSNVLGGLFGSNKAPKAPDPKNTIAEQTQANLDTARLNKRLNTTDSRGPFGSVSYTDHGNDRWSENAQFDPVIQSLIDRSVGAGGDIHARGLPGWQTMSSEGLPGLNVPGVENTSDIEDALYERSMSRLQPEIDKARSRTDATLAARGITSGSDASTKTYDDLSRRESDAFSNARLDAIAGAGAEQSRRFGISAARSDAMFRNRGQLFGEDATIAGFNNGVRGAGLDERMTLAQFPLQQAGGLIGLGNALKTGSQPAQVGVPTTDIAGINQNAYANRMGVHQSKIGQQNQALGGLFGLGSAAIGAW